MKLLITSDIHHNYKKLAAVLKKHPTITLHLDAGDSQLTNELLTKLKVISVSGNTDYNTDLPIHKILEVSNLKILLIHGHTLKVKSSYDLLHDFAIKNKVDLCIFGHTHNKEIFKVGNTLFLNPGSLGYDNTYIIYENKEARHFNLYE